VPICDGHDSAISTINMELIRGGIEVIYLGFHRSVRDIVRAAVQEDVAAIGLSSYNGGHVEFFGDVVAGLRRCGAADIGVFGGGGGTISAADAKAMQRKGVNRIFFAGTALEDVVSFAHQHYGRRAAAASKPVAAVRSDRDLARLLSAAERSTTVGSTGKDAGRTRRPLIVGVTGPGGAGKTTLIDELVLRFLQADPKSRIAILSHDPSLADRGALLGDRAAMIHAQNDRVFMRSLATRGQAGGLSAGTQRCLRALKAVGWFDVILVETVGIGQEAAPFAGDQVDHGLFVMGADYGSRLQLQKIAMLDAADIVVVNKSDLAGARTAANEIGQRLESNARGQRILMTTAKSHRDAGVDKLWGILHQRPAGAT
jgi:methylmalonyl-CoA mutase